MPTFKQSIGRLMRDSKNKKVQFIDVGTLSKKAITNVKKQLEKSNEINKKVDKNV